jgi:N-acetyl sugar amidotransferase
MKYCTRCLYPENHPLHITFNEEGVCSGCLIHEEKDEIDWLKRSAKLCELLESYKDNTKKNYDCIIPVSGSRDSFFIVHTIKKVYGMNPLLVTYNKHFNTPEGIKNLASLKTVFDCDLMTMTISPEIVKKITKVSLIKIGSMYWHCLAGSTVFPVQIATRFKIPLIIWGAHQGCDQVGMFSHFDEVEMTRKYRKEHDLMKHEAEALVDESMGLSHEDVRQFVYPHDKEIEKVGVRGIYLSNFIRWDTKKQHESMLKVYSYEIYQQERTFDTYNDVDCFHYSDLHDYIKFCKYGYGKVTDHASREIRLKRLTREEGIKLVKKYQEKTPKTYKLFADWLGVTKNGLQYIIDLHRGGDVWKRDKNYEWYLRDSVVFHQLDPGVEEARLDKKEDCKFLSSEVKKNKKIKKYILIGKGI